MSTDSNSSSDPRVALFKKNVSDFLEQAFLALAALTVIGTGLYLGFLPHNVQNSLPILLSIFLCAYSWILRAKILQVETEEIRVYLLQWIVLCTIVIIGTVIAIILYPYSKQF